MARGFAVVLTTCGGRDEARKIAVHLVEQRLAACVQMLPIESVYTWKGATETAQEILLLCKISRADYAAVEAAIRAAHSYEVPEIVEIAIEQGADSYLSWLAAAVAR
jgi:periplasmic divalent cation tolerance protein